MVWEQVVEQMRVETQPPVFDSWIRPAALYAWDPSAGVFTICAPSAYARDWLAGRMQSTISRVFSGIVARTVSVRFISPTDLQD